MSRLRAVCSLTFLDLPTEIRLIIYRKLLVNPRTIGDSRYFDYENEQTMGHYFDWEQFLWTGTGLAQTYGNATILIRLQNGK